MKMQGNKEYGYHQLTMIFPEMNGPPYEAMVEDVKANGLKIPIILDVQGKNIIDGRNRYRACLEAGVDPIFTKLTDDSKIFETIMSQNIHRRNLNSSQKAMIAARLATLKRGGQEKNKRVSSGKFQMSQKDAARILGIGVDSVKKAGNLLGSDAEDVKLLVGKVEAGEVTLNYVFGKVFGTRDKNKKTGKPEAESIAGKHPPVSVKASPASDNPKNRNGTETLPANDDKKPKVTKSSTIRKTKSDNERMRQILQEAVDLLDESDDDNILQDTERLMVKIFHHIDSGKIIQLISTFMVNSCVADKKGIENSLEKLVTSTRRKFSNRQSAMEKKAS